jgi:hypothetical protein
MDDNMGTDQKVANNLVFSVLNGGRGLFLGVLISFIKIALNGDYPRTHPRCGDPTWPAATSRRGKDPADLTNLDGAFTISANMHP